jgi:hypothetical protein
MTEERHSCSRRGVRQTMEEGVRIGARLNALCLPLASLVAHREKTVNSSMLLLRIHENVPFNHLALRYTLANICQLEPLKNLAGRPPRRRRMKGRDMSPPAESTSRLA